MANLGMSRKRLAKGLRLPPVPGLTLTPALSLRGRGQVVAPPAHPPCEGEGEAAALSAP